MGSKRILWAVNRPDGTPVIVNGVLADVDEDTNVIAPEKRAREIVDEVVAQEPSPTDMYLVPGIDLAQEVYRLIQAKNAAGIPIHDPLPPGSLRANEEQRLSVSPTESLSPEYQAIVDDTLALIVRQSTQYGKQIGQPVPSVSITALRESPFGRDLALLAHVAVGEKRAKSSDVFNLVDRVTDLLFHAPAESDHYIPWSFWEEPLGRMLSQAKMRSIEPSELTTINAAAQRFGVTRPTIYRWISGGMLSSVFDFDSGTRRIFLLRREVEELAESEMSQARSAPWHVETDGRHTAQPT